MAKVKNDIGVTKGFFSIGAENYTFKTLLFENGLNHFASRIKSGGFPFFRGALTCTHRTLDINPETFLKPFRNRSEA